MIVTSSIPRAGWALVLRPSMRSSYDTLKRWLEGCREVTSIAVLAQDDVAPLREALAPRPLRAVWPQGHSQGVRPFGRVWQAFISLVNRFEVVVVLCIGDAEVASGYSVYRILAELLFSDYIVLIGPHTARVWPGGRGLFSPKRVRELSLVAAAVAIGTGATAVAIGAVALQEAGIRVRLLR